MTHLYEGMFLLDNSVVRDSWKKAKAEVTDLLDKHGATVHTARRWDERRLAYPIKGHGRASYLLCHFDLDTDRGPALVRDLELRETVLRHLILRTEEVPEQEKEANQAEQSDDFVVPAPPVETARRVVEEAPVEEVAPAEASEKPAEGEGEAKKDDAPAEEAKAEEAKTEAPAEAEAKKED